ncbi:MAG: hypothetical protein JW839_20475 [Candidatus Lokiarchaeota archaeon]|nr:hypothetical protein [Candidatus Lokiarchaeota archaeon]
MKISNTGAKGAIGALAGWIAAAVVIWVCGASWFAETGALIPLSLSSFVIIASIALAGILLLVLGGTYKFSSSMGKVWTLMGIGLLLWLAGEIIYYGYDFLLVLDENAPYPFPSAADFFYYAAYAPLAIGLIVQVRLLKVALGKLEKVVVVILSVLVGLAIAIFVLWPTIEFLFAEDPSIIYVLAGVLYPILDIFLLACVFIVSAKLRHGKINVAWILVLTGLILTTVADSMYWLGYINAVDEMFNWYDFAFLASYLLIAMGAIKGINVISTSFSS